MKTKVEQLEKELSTSAELRGRLNEVLATARLQKRRQKDGAGEGISFDSTGIAKIKKVLSCQQQSIVHLLNELKNCKDIVELMDEENRELAEKAGF